LSCGPVAERYGRKVAIAVLACISLVYGLPYYLFDFLIFLIFFDFFNMIFDDFDDF
jgi:hypothetical protein